MRLFGLSLLLACGGSAGNERVPEQAAPDAGAAACEVRSEETMEIRSVRCDLVIRAAQPRGCFLVEQVECVTWQAEYQAGRVADSTGCDVVLEPSGSCD